ncbi:MAG TPA: hypothetical protein VG294_11095 [Solirubrobacteraceae bacterium]|jgi:hypothetical protein|nr:hypothetical protein [Solirubrobacteraceae bacterium]
MTAPTAATTMGSPYPAIVKPRRRGKRNDWRDLPMFLSDRSTRTLGARAQVRALDAWRESARIASARWAAFLDAEPDARSWAFMSYVAALDAEEAAAAEMAGLRALAAA